MTSASLPVIDLARNAAAIGPVARDIGFFYVRDHGVPNATIEAAFAAGRALFAAPVSLRESVSITNSRHNRGYVGMGAEALDPTKPADAKEAFNIGRELPPDDPDRLAGAPFHGVNQWPNLPGFRETLLDAYAALHGLAARLHEIFAADLGLPKTFFAPFIDRPLSTLRLLHYPPHPGAFDGTRHGAAPHTDYGCVTILAQDEVGGLEVRRRDGTWIEAPPLAGAFVCNIGDCLMRWSNDIYVSTPHRVVNRAGRERYSLAFFSDPNADAPVACLPTCTDADRPPRYAPTTGAAYLQERLDATYAFRRNPP